MYSCMYACVHTCMLARTNTHKHARIRVCKIFTNDFE